MVIKLIAFAIGTLGIIFISLHSASKLRSYGFLRFFAFESILVLILFNIEHWFRNPFSISQIISWLFLVASIVMVASGFYMLRTFGKPKDVIDDTAVLVTRGIYKYIRHPLYSSLILLAWGVFLKDISFISFALALVASGLPVAMAKIEEKENIQKFGEEYSSYIKSTKMFIPFII
ncbi:MAG: isoprenylcysteine carboxylmethyltransferase family protein [Dehalococcoidia bacterium]|nr:MAG: isoprenylcysteine carboxylmethyltransferase family protein [Dehalococcoidia bacterium]